MFKKSALLITDPANQKAVNLNVAEMFVENA